MKEVDCMMLLGTMTHVGRLTVQHALVVMFCLVTMVSKVLTCYNGALIIESTTINKNSIYFV